MASEATPRISSENLETFMHKTVRVLGRVVSIRGETCTIDAKGSINVQLPRDTSLQQDSFVDIVGKVTPELTIKAYQATDFGTNIDVKVAEAVVDVTHRHKEIFYDPNR